MPNHFNAIMEIVGATLAVAQTDVNTPNNATVAADDATIAADDATVAADNTTIAPNNATEYNRWQ